MSSTDIIQTEYSSMIVLAFKMGNFQILKFFHNKKLEGEKFNKSSRTGKDNN